MSRYGRKEDEAEEHCNGVLGLSAFSPVNGRLAVDNNNLLEA